MFYDCEALTLIDLRDCDFSYLSYVDNAFYNVKKAVIFTPLNIRTYREVKLEESVTWMDNAGNIYTMLPQMMEESIMLFPQDASSFAKIDKIDLEPDTLNLYYNIKDKTSKIKAILTIDGMQEEWDETDLTKLVTWTSSDPSVATVSGGVVMAVGEGTAVITAASAIYPDVKAACTVRVSTWVQPYYRINRASLDLDLKTDTKGEIIPYLRTDYITEPDIVTWKSSDPGVATVEVKTREELVGGKAATIYVAEVTAVTEGEAVITATFPEGHSAKSCTVKVIEEKTDDSVMHWEIDSEGTLFVKGSGELHDDTKPGEPYENLPWYERRNEIKRANIEVSNCKDMSYLFYGCENLTYASFYYSDLSATTDISHMYEGCRSLTLSYDEREYNYDSNGYPYVNWSLDNADNLADMSYLFKGCTSLKYVKVNMYSWEVGHLRTMAHMFEDCTGLEQLDFYFTDQNGMLEDISSLFSGCTSLKRINLRDFEFPTTISRCDDIFKDVDCTLYTPMYIYTEIPLGEGWKDAEGNSYDKLSANPAGVGVEGLMLFRPNSMPTGGRVNDITWYIDKLGILHVEGTGDYWPEGKEHTYENIPWYAYRDQIFAADVKVRGMTDQSYMFYGCKNLRNADLSYSDEDQVTSMRSMYEGCSSLTGYYFHNWYYSQGDKVKDISRMFYGCSTLANADLNWLESINVTDMSYLFYGCSSLQYAGLGGGDGYDAFTTEKAEDLSYMFYGCENLRSLNLKKFDTSSAVRMDHMFDGCKDLEILDMSHFNMEHVTSAEHMLDGLQYLIHTPYNVKIDVNLQSGWKNTKNEPIAMLSKDSFEPADSIVLYGPKRNANEQASGVVGEITWSIDEDGKLTIKGRGDYGTGEYPYAPWREYDNLVKAAEVELTDVTSLYGMFLGCRNMTSVDLSGLNSSKAVSTEEMFYGCESLEVLDLSSMDTSSVTNMSGMFEECKKLAMLNLENFNTSKVTDMSKMFRECESLAALDLSMFDTSNVTSMAIMFSLCSELETLDLSSFDTGKVKNMGTMFYECKKLKEISFGLEFDTYKVTSMHYMFDGCESLEALDLSGFNTAEVTDMADMKFRGKGQYAGDFTVEFAIEKASLEAMYEEESLAVTAPATPYKVVNTKDYLPKVTVKDGKTALKENKDYIVSYSNCSQAAVEAYHEAIREDSLTDAIRPQVKITGTEDGKYTGEITYYLNIYDPAYKLSADTVYIVINTDECVYDDRDGGRNLRPAATVYYGDKAKIKAAKKAKETKESVLTGENYGLTILKKDAENGYTLVYAANKLAGKGKGSLTISGTGLYGGSVTQKFDITPKNMFKSVFQ